MTPDELDAIRERAAAATTGKWSTDNHKMGAGVVMPIPKARPGGELAWDSNPNRFDEYAVAQQHADATFIAHARTDVPVLLAEIDRVRAAQDDPVAAMKAGRAALDKHNDFLIEKGRFTCNRCGWSGPNVNDHRALIAWSAARSVLGEES